MWTTPALLLSRFCFALALLLACSCPAPTPAHAILLAFIIISPLRFFFGTARAAFYGSYAYGNQHLNDVLQKQYIFPYHDVTVFPKQLLAKLFLSRRIYLVDIELVSTINRDEHKRMPRESASGSDKRATFFHVKLCH